MIRQEQQALWKKIAAFQINDPEATLNFSIKLASANGWSKPFTERVIEEYKKFIFLCCVIPEGASPSAIVDGAWHMHLTYTVSYWKEFCEKTIGRDIHHHPSKGGNAEKHRHTDWYDRTLENYKYYFGSDPPEDIWPPGGGFDLISKNKPPDLSFIGRKFNPALLLCFLPAFFVPIFYKVYQPFALTGPQFLNFFMVLIGCTALFIVLRYRQLKADMELFYANLDLKDKNIYQITKLLYGGNRMVQTAIVDLVARGVLVPEKGNIFLINKYPEKDEGNPLLPGLRKTTKEGESISMQWLLYTELNEETTFAPDLYQMFQHIRSRDLSLHILLCALGLAGIIRMIQGLVNEKPVEYLFIMLLATLVLGISTVAGISEKKILQQIFKKKFSIYDYSMEGFTSSVPAMSFAFIGITAIAGLDGFNNLSNSFSNYFRKDSVLTSGGCGSSGCGSSCGGSGCGGGGCGGCGS